MKKFVVVSLLAGVLAACSTTASAPTGLKLSQNIQTVASNSIISVISQSDFAVPKHAQNIMQLGTFKTNDNVYDPDGNKILIPRDAIISGLYSNDGVNCMIEWKGVYANLTEYRNKNGSPILRELTTESLCDPQHEIKKGDRVTISFRPAISE